ncbi:MAG: M20/M25/M40 family metallo-hydrolase [Bacteroidota bacterium]|nr:M20/M25/M40 family metallo-hydrolase [Bacteroidota bacterium]
MKLFKLLFILFFTYPSFIHAQTEHIDQSMMQKIRQEGLQNSKVMDIAFHLTDASGPRLTASPGFMRAANYAKNKLAQWGLTNTMLDPWGDFGKSWELQKSYVAMTAPWYKSFEAYPKAWAGGTNGLRNAEAILISAKDSAGLDAYLGKLKGKVLILDRTDKYDLSFKADAKRYTDADLDSMENFKPQPIDTATQRRRRDLFQRQGGGGGLRAMMSTLNSLAVSEGAVAMVSTSPRNHDGTIFVQQAGPYKVTDPANFLDIALGYEDYMTLVRLLRNNIPVKLDVDVQTKFYSDDTKGYNVIGEIKGTDNNLKDEIVMLGGHLDSWHGATGATDNAAGSAVMLEAIRILKTLNVQPRRTIRIALWSGEEQGIFGSRGYVKKTFADPADMKLLPAHEKFSSYFNVDNGTGKIRGIYLQGNEAARNIFQQWLAPFNDLGAKTVTISNTGGTDHLSFDAVGLPGFQFIQDPLEYDSRNHHSNMDAYDHLQEDDLKQAATIVAAFVYNAAMRDQKIPRKELPQPRPAGQRGF